MESHSTYFLSMVSFVILVFKFIHAVACITNLFYFITVWFFIVGMYHNLFIHLPIGGYFGYLQISASMNKAGMNICA